MFNENEMKILKNSLPQDFLKILYEKIGEEGFANSKMLNAYVSDLLFDDTGFKKRLCFAITSNIQLYVLREPAGLLETTRLQQIIQSVKNSTGMSEAFAEEIIWMFGYATGRIKSYSKNQTFYKFLRPVKVHNKYGFADENNNVVIAPKYDRAKPFICDRAKVCLNGKFGFIDRSGAEIIPIIYDKASDFCAEQAETVLDGKTIIIGMNGQTIL